ncbi:DUF6986 family protein [Streptomyces orinoci]|uniref:Aldolase/citrate lyase family protein n=1 Tax=Streptomyces orinoci TaxID=67339 RepID=A0ABV3K1B6_STRON|nr:aldolase/citrate lyase family protein [Streptomyces orinoci]
MGTARRTLDSMVAERIGVFLAPADAELARRYPGETGGRQPVHTVYVPADAVHAGTVRSWGEQALAALDQHAPSAGEFAAVLGIPAGLAEPVWQRVRAKLAAEPVEDLRIDFEDGYGSRPGAEEDQAALHAAELVATTAVPFAGIRVKSLEAPVRDRAIRTLDIFLTALLTAGGLPAGLRLTLPKVSHPDQVTAMARLTEEFERAYHLPGGRIRFEVQIETTQAILGADGRATVARLIEAGEGRVSALHYGTYDYSAACGVAPDRQSADHPVADHAKAVMQVAAAGTGVWLSDGSSNVLPAGDTAQVHHAWRLHHRLVRRALARAYHQGWDMHPAQLPTRYAAVFAFYREGLDRTTARLAAYTGGRGGTVLDEPATARALSAHLLRGLDCGALTPAEVPLPRPTLEQLAGHRTLP